MSCRNEIEAFIDAVEASFNLVKTPIHAIEAPSLACDLHLEMADLCHHVTHRGLKSKDTRLEVRDIGFELVNFCHKPVESTSHVTEMFKDQIVRFVSHTASLANPGLTRQSILFKRCCSGRRLVPRPN